MDLSIRQLKEQREIETLSKAATLSVNTKGRKTKEEECEIRTAFQRDRDRVIHSNAFRRLKHKTQVFLSPEGDHYRTRLTHTLEVSQIARTIASALNLNEDLTEAIALGHDLGHTPFGHAGERALREISQTGFNHFEQSVRVCERLEKGGKGLNLTYEVLDGILHHTRDEWAETLEGRIVRWSDRIAYINHDIDDAMRAGIIKEKDIPEDITQHLGHSKSQRINHLVKSIVSNSLDDIVMDQEDFYHYDRLHSFLYERVYLNRAAKREEEKVDGIINGLFEYYSKNVEAMTADYRNIAESEGVERAVIDYISGMTDPYAVQVFEDIYVPRSWNK